MSICGVWYFNPGYLGGALKVFWHLLLPPEHLLCFVCTWPWPGNPPFLSPVPYRLVREYKFICFAFCLMSADCQTANNRTSLTDCTTKSSKKYLSCSTFSLNIHRFVYSVVIFANNTFSTYISFFSVLMPKNKIISVCIHHKSHTSLFPSSLS